MSTNFSLHRAGAAFISGGISNSWRRSLAFAAVAGSTFAVAGAQTVPTSAGTTPFTLTVPAPASALHTSGFAPDAFVPSALAPDAQAADGLFSSSAAGAASPADSGTAAANMNLASLEKGIGLPGVNAQYGRRRYGAPRYRGGNTNADGSEKYTAYAGAGVGIPLGNQHKYDTASWGFQVGAGRNFNKNFGLNVEFDWDHFGLQGSTLNQQAFIEDPTGQFGLLGNTDGYSHLWSLSVQPIYNIKQGEGLGAYVTAGGGYYHKVTTFTTPQTEVINYFGILEEIEANEPFDSYTSNAPGVDGGFGLTYKFSRFANQRLYAEVRYVVTFNSQRTGINGSNYNNYAPTYNYPTTDLYPANSNRSTYIPIKFGIRF